MVVTLWPTQSPILSLWTSLVLSVSRLQVLMAPLVSPLTRTLVLARLELAMSVMAATCWRYLASTVQYSTVQYSTPRAGGTWPPPGSCSPPPPAPRRTSRSAQTAGVMTRPLWWWCYLASVETHRYEGGPQGRDTLDHGSSYLTRNCR